MHPSTMHSPTSPNTQRRFVRWYVRFQLSSLDIKEFLFAWGCNYGGRPEGSPSGRRDDPMLVTAIAILKKTAFKSIDVDVR